ncbi:DUF4123 domain-containing protein [Ralstonia insidiosa]|uniref:DUF4123 domain-containing protein n=1 Tax=Ralstonia insidiosa TaxID=190721 RepID=UPI001FC9DB17|nr:DUF4123 domain-containing protein [Ralstonia insidiosa]
MPFDDLLRTLGESLHADDEESAYLLLDPMLREPLERDFVLGSGCEIFPLEMASVRLSKHQIPYLIRLSAAAVHILRVSLEVALQEQANLDVESNEGFAVGGWLRSAVEPRLLAKHLARCMTPAGMPPGARYLRLADRRVFELAWSVSDLPQRQEWLGPISQWWTLDRRNSLVPHAANQPLAWQLGYLRLAPEQWRHLRNCELVQQLLRGWQRFQPALPPDYLKQAANAIEAAQSLELEQAADIVLLAAYVLQIHPRLCQHPRVVELVKSALKQPPNLAQRLSELPDDAWDAIRQELMHASNSHPSIDPLTYANAG